MANLWTLAQVFGRSACEHPDYTAILASASRSICAQVDVGTSSLVAAMVELEPRAGKGVGARNRRRLVTPAVWRSRIRARSVYPHR